MAFFFIIFFIIYGSANYYIFIRGWQALEGNPQFKIYYLIIFLIFSLSYLLGKILTDYLSILAYDVLLWIGSFWFAFMLYFFLAVILLDLSRLINHFFPYYASLFTINYISLKFITLLIVVVLTCLIILLGFLNTRNIKINTINIIMSKGNSQLSELNIAMVADIHLSPMDNESLLEDIIEKINSLEPDIVLMPGDIVDDKSKVLRDRGIGPYFRNLKSKYGVYASTGNHEFITGVDSSFKFMEDYGIKVLRDKSELIAGSFYIIGRDDSSKINFTRTSRKTLKQIMGDVSADVPKILLDHTPFKLEEAMENGIDLQLSGHTHHGQMFPNNLITNMIYEVSWGYLKKRNTHYYVTSGAGTWGPPVRIGSDAEMVNIKIKFE